MDPEIVLGTAQQPEDMARSNSTFVHQGGPVCGDGMGAVCSHLGKGANFSFYKFLLWAHHMPEAELYTGRYGGAFLGALVSGGSWIDSASRQSLGVIVKQHSGLDGMGH